MRGGGASITLRRTFRLVGLGIWVTTTKSAAVAAARAAAMRVNFILKRNWVFECVVRLSCWL